MYLVIYEERAEARDEDDQEPNETRHAPPRYPGSCPSFARTLCESAHPPQYRAPLLSLPNFMIDCRKLGFHQIGTKYAYEKLKIRSILQVEDASATHARVWVAQRKIGSRPS